MSFNKLFSLLDDDIKTKSFITNMSSGFMEVPYIVSETLNMLDDDSPMYNIITDKNKKSLCIMLNEYMKECLELFIEDLKLDSLLKFGKIEIYKVESSNGLRYATVNEIAQGIKGLIGEYIFPAGENEYKLLSLLEWTFYGKSYYFRQSGNELKYSNDGKVITSFYEMVQSSAYQLKELFDWVSVRDNIDKALKKIRKMKRSNGYKYATYEKDEIVEDITIKQLLYNICNTFPRNSSNIEYRKALALALKQTKRNIRLTPLEISTLREIYDKHALDTNRSSTRDDNADDELRKKCEYILKERFSGRINQNHFAYTIIETLKKYNYSRCSPKQYSIIDDAYNILYKDSGKQKENSDSDLEETPVISDNDIDLSLSSLSDAIGGGLFEDD